MSRPRRGSPSWGRARHDQPDHEQPHRRGQRRSTPPAIAPRADGDHADDARRERARRRPPRRGRAVEVGAHDRHDRRDRERLHRREEDQGDRADGDPDELRAPDATATPDGAGANGEWSIGPVTADERADSLDRLAEHVGRAAEVDADVALALVAEEGPVVECDRASRQDLHGGIVAPPEAGEVDPRQEAGIRDPIPRPGNVLGEQVREQPPVGVERGEQAVEPLVALRRERRVVRRAPRTVRSATPPRTGSARSTAAVLVAAVDHERALEPGEVEALLALVDGVADLRAASRGGEERREAAPGVHERRVDLVADHDGAVSPRRSRRGRRDSARVCTVPVGLCGLHSSTARAPAARAASMPARSSSQPASDVASGTRSTTAPASGMHVVERRVHGRRDDDAVPGRGHRAQQLDDAHHDVARRADPSPGSTVQPEAALARTPTIRLADAGLGRGVAGVAELDGARQRPRDRLGASG